MRLFETHRNLLIFLRGLSLFFGIWPLDTDAGYFKKLINNAMWWFFTISSGATVPPLCLGIYYYRSDLVNMMKSLVEVTYISEAFFNCIYCRVQRPLLTVLLSEIESFDKNSSEEEKVIRKKFLKPTNVFYTIMPLVFIVGALIFVFSPLSLPNRVVPLNTIYPFPVNEKYWAKCLVYALNNLSILIASVAIIVDLIVVMILWFSAYKFSLIGIQFNNITTYKYLCECIEQHKEAIRYSKDTERAVSYIIVKSTAAISIYLITCSLLILNNVPIYELTQFFLITFLSCIRLFICSWSADVMTDMAEEVSWCVYNSNWADKSLKIRKSVQIIIQRCRRPCIISVQGIIPVLSLRFCTSVLYKTFSYFMTLRALLIA
ncbi:odorant receptor 85f-like [Prorops nasuta]|uniref:odorant receptor 85f-like n=1 Tax=Prorops nasuta TaxID=863751 RepID=UPI0034CF23B5